MILVILALLICFPVWFVLTGGFMAQWELEQDLAPVFGGSETVAQMTVWSLLPHAPTLASLIELLMDSPEFFVMFWNSLKITFAVLAGQVLFGVPAAWALARYDFPGKGVISAIYLILMLMPFQVLMLPEYLVLNRLHLLDTHLGMILPVVFSTFPVFIMQSFFRGVPEAILEAARIDGAGDLRCFLWIGLPMGRPGIMSAILLGFLEAWNMIEQPMTFLKTKTLWPLSLFLPDISLSNAGPGFAAALMMLIPALLLFLSGQDYLEQGISAAAVKE